MAKTYKNLLPLIYDFKNLHAAYLKARLGKRFSGDVLRFACDLEPNLIQLQNELVWNEYRTGRYYLFRVYEPKERIVAALPFRDRVIQHAIHSIIEPLWENRFIFDTYACRQRKGTHAGADRAQLFIRQVLQRHGKVYCLKADIRRYFESIDHGILRSLLKKRISCAGTTAILDEIIASTADPDDLAPRGIPIGNLTSQLFANIYLHELDEYVKYNLREPRYVRYMDDFVIIHNDKAHLHQIRADIEAFLWDRLRLHTNSKTQVFPVGMYHGRALDFLGYRIWPSHRKLRPDSVRRMKKRLKRLQASYAENKVTLAGVNARIQSWLGHARHADSFGLRSKLMGKTVFRKN